MAVTRHFVRRRGFGGVERPLLAILLAGLCLLGCVPSGRVREGTLDEYPNYVELPLVRQGTIYSCGIAALHSLLRWASPELDINDQYLMEACGTTSEDGTPVEAIREYLEGTGMFELSWRQGISRDELKSVIDDGGVVLMPIQAWETKVDESGNLVPYDADDYSDYWDAGHWVIACGYNDSEVLFMDPSTAGSYTSMSWGDLDARWHDGNPSASIRLERAGLIVFKTGGEEYDRDEVRPLS